MIDIQSIKDNYINLCNINNKKLSRSEYRKVSKKYSTSLIEKKFGNWTSFINKCNDFVLKNRNDISKEDKSFYENIVITYAVDGANVNKDVFLTLKNYCKVNKAKLIVLWGKSYIKNCKFDEETYSLLSEFLCTKFILNEKYKCLIQDFLIPISQKNPLVNLDKLSSFYKTIVVGSVKQYIRVLPYKQCDDLRIACSTGTISDINYKSDINGNLNCKNHTYGAILLNYNKDKKRYLIRNLEYKNGVICDLNKEYNTKNVIDIKSNPALVLGDLHFPEEDEKAILKSKEQIKLFKPKFVMIHDIASWNSISHHEQYKFLDKVKNSNDFTKDLYSEINAVVSKLKAFTFDFQNTKFKIVHSNHDDFITKWLNEGEFIKDKNNSKIGAELFLEYLKGNKILTKFLPKNVAYLPENKTFSICGFELSEHGDNGISGAKGSINTYNKSFDGLICGHTHSPEKYEKTIIVGTLSKLILNYNQKGLTKWAHANAIIYNNGSSQLLFI